MQVFFPSLLNEKENCSKKNKPKFRRLLPSKQNEHNERERRKQKEKSSMLNNLKKKVDPISSDSEGVYSQSTVDGRESSKLRRYSTQDSFHFGGNNGGGLQHDPISSFSTDFDLASQELIEEGREVEENMLKDLDNWDPQVHSPDISDNELPEIEEEDEEDFSHHIIDTIPHFEPFQASTPTIPEPELPQFVKNRSSKKKNNIKFIKNGLADNALKLIIKEQEEFDKWERHINREMASSRSIAHVCSKSEDAHVCRMLETWEDHGLVFSWCVLLNDDEMEQILGTNSRSSINNNGFDDIEEFSQPCSLPPYEYKEGDQRLLVMFSFSYMMNPAVSKKRFIENEKLVGIWPPLNHIKLDFGEGEEDVLMVTRFKADSIY